MMGDSPTYSISDHTRPSYVQNGEGAWSLKGDSPTYSISDQPGPRMCRMVKGRGP